MHTIVPIPAFNDNYIWAIIHPLSKKCIVVDPGDAAPVEKFLTQHTLHLTDILITHHHADHVNGIPSLVKRYGAQVYGPSHDPVKGLNYPLTENDNVSLASVQLELNVLEVPGHTAGHIAFINDQIALTGDTLFTAGCGRLFEGTAEQMYRSLQKLAQLSTSTLIYCAHEYTESNLKFAQAVEPANSALQQRILETRHLRSQGLPTVPSTLEIERATNPFLRCHLPNVWQAAAHYSNQQLHSPIEVFATLRQWKNNF